MDTTLPTFDEVASLLDANASNWVRAAIVENIQRDTLFATEDLIMLADIFVAISKGTLVAPKILATPIIGSWLRAAIERNMPRNWDDVIRDAQIVRDVFVRVLCLSYMAGKYKGPDAKPRVRYILNRFSDIQEEIALSWRRAAGARLSECAERTDGGSSHIFEMAKSQGCSGNREMAEQLDQLSHLAPGELRKQLLQMASYLNGSQSRLN
jgi:hypothetical protein